MLDVGPEKAGPNLNGPLEDQAAWALGSRSKGNRKNILFDSLEGNQVGDGFVWGHSVSHSPSKPSHRALAKLHHPHPLKNGIGPPPEEWNWVRGQTPWNSVYGNPFSFIGNTHTWNWVPDPPPRSPPPQPGGLAQSEVLRCEWEPSERTAVSEARNGQIRKSRDPSALSEMSLSGCLFVTRLQGSSFCQPHVLLPAQGSAAARPEYAGPWPPCRTQSLEPRCRLG